ncbi:MAG: hypothetical protein QM765_43350 [Myxococcales bacterium]
MRGATRQSQSGGRGDALFGALPALGALAALLAYGALAAFPGLGRAPVRWSAPASAAAFGLAQLLFPASQPRRAQLLCPLNWALAAFFMQLVVLPLLVCVWGPDYGALTALPGPGAIDASLVVSIVSFAAFSAGCSVAAPSTIAANEARPPPGPPSAFLVLAYAAVGSLGLVVGFGSFLQLPALLADPAKMAQAGAEMEGTLQGAASTFLRPFLLNAVVMAWCLWIDRRGALSGRPARWALSAAAVLAVLLIGASYSFNRAAFVVPLVAMAAVYSARVRRISVPALLAGGAVLGALALASGTFRAGSATAEDLAKTSSAREAVLDLSDLSTQLQVYGNAPQFTAFLLEQAERSPGLFNPRVLAGSVLSPVPILGKGFRDESGFVVYNRLIYGRTTEFIDQVIPFEAEVYLCLGPLGLLGAFGLLGFAVGRLQRRFERAGPSYERFAVQFVAIWLAFLVQGALSSLAQVVVFFLWPVYGYALLRLIASPWAGCGAATGGFVQPVNR